MLNRIKIWAYVAALFGGALLSSGCLFGSNKWVIPVTMWLQEDLFG